MWQRFAGSISLVAMSRTKLLTDAVTTAASRESLEAADLAVIRELLAATSNRSAVVKCVSLIFSKLPLGNFPPFSPGMNCFVSAERKIKFLEMALDVAKTWLNTEVRTDRPTHTVPLPGARRGRKRAHRAVRGSHRARLATRAHGIRARLDGAAECGDERLARESPGVARAAS